MIALLAALSVSQPGAPPATLTVLTPRGEVQIAVRHDGDGAPVIPASLLVRALNGSWSVTHPWAEMTVARRTFRFLLDARSYVFQGTVWPLAAATSLRGDTLLIPFQFVTEILPRVFSERYRYEAGSSRLIEMGPRAAVTPEPARLSSGLRPGHVVAVDPGHGGTDPGNPGLYFPRGVDEKHVTFQVSLLLRAELQKRGIQVRMTRTRDTLIALADRPRYCTEECELFVSIHVNSLNRSRGYTTRRGFETYIIGEARTEDAERVARMENDAIRFESSSVHAASPQGLDFILRDLQLNEHLRESARAAELIQEKIDPVHSGENRGVKGGPYHVLNNARRPAVLVELGYSTNPDDARLMTRRSGQEALASAIADAVVEYLLEYERKTGSGPQ